MKGNVVDKYTKQYLAEEVKNVKRLTKFVKTIPAIAGWVGEWKDETFWYGQQNHPTKRYQLINEELKIKMTFRPGGDGTTEYWLEKQKFWASFDRRGVESSFYYVPLWETDKVPPVTEIVARQVERVLERRRYHESSIAIPEIGFTISPEHLPKLKEELKKNGYRSFMPSGFGTGKTVSVKRSKYNCKRATQALEDFMGMSPLYVSSFDAD